MALSTKAILGKRTLYQLDAVDYIEWAREMLMQDYDSYSLRILAGLEPLTSTSEAEDYFLRSAKEINLSIPDSEMAIRSYACEIAQQIVDEQLTGQEGVRVLYRICLATEYNQDYLIWLELDDALDSLLSMEYAYTYESATLENFDEVAKQEAEKFILKMNGKASI
jgi:hypothetical protein